MTSSPKTSQTTYGGPKQTPYNSNKYVLSNKKGSRVQLAGPFSTTTELQTHNLTTILTPITQGTLPEANDNFENCMMMRNSKSQEKRRVMKLSTCRPSHDVFVPNVLGNPKISSGSSK